LKGVVYTILLKKPDIKSCTFPEFRNWVMVNFLLMDTDYLERIHAAMAYLKKFLVEFLLGNNIHALALGWIWLTTDFLDVV
jgi:hypothetical protein